LPKPLSWLQWAKHGQGERVQNGSGKVRAQRALSLNRPRAKWGDLNAYNLFSRSYRTHELDPIPELDKERSGWVDTVPLIRSAYTSNRCGACSAYGCLCPARALQLAKIQRCYRGQANPTAPAVIRAAPAHWRRVGCSPIARENSTANTIEVLRRVAMTPAPSRVRACR
jgi:hypothetical protein